MICRIKVKAYSYQREISYIILKSLKLKNAMNRASQSFSLRFSLLSPYPSKFLQDKSESFLKVRNTPKTENAMNRASQKKQRLVINDLQNKSESFLCPKRCLILKNAMNTTFQKNRLLGIKDLQNKSESFQDEYGSFFSFWV